MALAKSLMRMVWALFQFLYIGRKLQVSQQPEGKGKVMDIIPAYL